MRDANTSVSELVELLHLAGILSCTYTRSGTRKHVLKHMVMKCNSEHRQSKSYFIRFGH